MSNSAATFPPRKPLSGDGRLDGVAHFRAVFEATDHMMGLLRLDGTLIYINPAFLHAGGMEREALVGKTLWEGLAEQASFEMQAQMQAVVERAAQGVDVRTEARLHLPDGEVRSLDLHFKPLFDEDGAAELLLLEGRDVTQRIRAERNYETLSRRFGLILDSAGEGIYGLDAEGRTTFVNEAAAKMLGYTPDELIGKPQHATIHHTYADGRPYPRESCPIYAAFNDGEVHYGVNEVFWRKDGTSFPVEYTSTPIREDGELMGAVVVFRDVTERQNALIDRIREAQDAALFTDSLKELHRITTTHYESLGELLEDYLRTGCKIFGMEVGVVNHVQGEACVFEAAYPAAPGFEVGTQYHMSEMYCAAVVENLRTVTYPDANLIEALHDHPAYRNLNVKSYLGTPVRVGGALYGVLLFVSQQPRAAFETYHSELIELMAESIGRFIELDQSARERERATHALAEQKARVQLLQEITEAANEADVIDEAMALALERICAFTGWPVGHVYLMQDRVLEPTDIWHFDDAARFEKLRTVTAETTFGKGEGLPGRVLASGRPAWIADVNDDSDFTRLKRAGPLGIRAGFAFPVLVGRDVVAVLEFFAEEALPPDEALLAVMVPIGTQLGRVVERVQTAEALRSSEERYRTLTETAAVAIVTADRDGIIRDWNQGAEAIFGYPKEEIQGRNIDTLMPPRYAEAHHRGMERHLKTGVNHVIGQTVELHGLRSDGKEFPIELSLSQWQATGRTFYTAIIRDITERVEAEARLRRSELQNRAIIDALPDALTRLSRTGEYLEVRLPRDYKSVADPEVVIGRTVHEVLPPTVGLRAVEAIEKALETGEVQTFEYEVEVAGEMRVREARVVSCGDDEVLSVQRDITERTRAEEALRESELQLRRALQIARLGSWELEVESGLFSWSDELFRIYGRAPQEELTFEEAHTWMHPEDREAVEAAREAAIRKKKPLSLFHRLVRPDGQERIIHVEGEVLTGDDGRVTRLFGTALDVTELKRAEEEIRASEERYRLLAEHATDLILRYSPQGDITYASPAARRFGYEPEEMIGRSGYDFIHPDDQAELQDVHASLLDSPDIQTVQYRFLKPDGAYVWAETAARPVLDSDTGELVELLSITRDVTERRQAQQQLERSRQLLSGILSSSLDGIMALEAVRDEDGRIVDFEWLLANPAAAAMTKRPAEELLGNRLLTVAPTAEEIGLLGAYAQVVETGEPFDTVIFYEDDHIKGWFHLTAVKLGDGVTVTFQDITEQRQAAERLAQSEDLLNRAQEIAHIGSWEWVVPTGALLWSDELYRIYGLEPGEEMGFERFISFTHEEERERVIGIIQQAMETHEPFSFYHPITRLDGEDRIIRGDGIVVTDEDGAVLKMYGTAHDVTEVRKAEEARQRLVDILEATPDFVGIADADGHVVYINQNGLRMVGLDPDTDVVGREISEFVAPSMVDHLMQEAVPTAFREGMWSGEMTFQFEGGPAVPTSEVIMAHQTPEGRVEYLSTIARDITERKKAEIEMARINAQLEQRNRELQDFAYVASHDLQEPLRKIRAFADLMIEDYDDQVDETGQYYLERMQDAAGRMSRLISDLLAYSRVTTKARPFEEVDLNTVVADVLSDLEMQIFEAEGSIEVEPLPTIEADPTQMRQLFQNFIANALKFHAEGKRPIVNVSAAVEQSTILGGAQQSVCRIEIADEGIGFDEKYLDRIFTPFQRLHTRGEYAGTGMGLAICRRIVERHQGRITARSAPGEGATFIITLPVDQPTAHADED